MNDFRSIVRAAALLHDEIVGARAQGTPPSMRFARLRADLDSALSSPDVEAVRDLEARWAHLIGTAFKGHSDYESLLARLPVDDPVKAQVGLLELIGRTRRETLHTEAIAGLVNPRSRGGVARLRALLQVVLAKTGRNVPDGLEEAKVLVEHSYVVRSGRLTRFPTPDLLLEVGSMLFVIENKVDALDRAKQLSSYARAASAHHAGESFLVYLTPTGEPPTQDDATDWIPISYRDLTLQWRAIMATDEASGFRWADAERAYLTTLSRSICKWRLDRFPTIAGRARMLPYLRAATGDARE